jgi:hypothetical protein
MTQAATARLLLRPWQADDLERLVALHADRRRAAPVTQLGLRAGSMASALPCNPGYCDSRMWDPE